MALSDNPIKTLAAYRSDHRIVEVDGRCATDGIPVYRIRGGTLRHDQWEIAKLEKAAAMQAVDQRAEHPLECPARHRVYSLSDCTCSAVTA